MTILNMHRSEGFVFVVLCIPNLSEAERCRSVFGSLLKLWVGEKGKEFCESQLTLCKHSSQVRSSILQYFVGGQCSVPFDNQFRRYIAEHLGQMAFFTRPLKVFWECEKFEFYSTVYTPSRLFERISEYLSAHYITPCSALGL